MRSEFPICHVSSCPRLCNQVADCLATHGRVAAASGPAVWLDQVHEFVSELVSGDLHGTGG